jgi:4'-phosphopantetheinyl transferase
MRTVITCPTHANSGSGLDSDVHVWCVKLRGNRELVARARSLLTADERSRADGFRFRELRDDFALSRGSLRVLLSGLGFGTPADLRFTYGPQGKPALDPSSSVRFNLSHSEGIFACAFARERDVGIDIEYQRPIADCEGIARRFFSPAEQSELMSINEPQRTVAFYNCWVRKEAFVKALGGGLSIPLDCFRVSVAPGHGAALLSVRNRPEEARAWTMFAFSPAPGFSGAIAFRDKRRRIRIHHADAGDIFVDAGLV